MLSSRSFINPILKRDILVNSRNARMMVAITLINILFAVIAGVLFATNRDASYQTYYSNVAGIFPILAMSEIEIIALVIPILTSTSISGERERQTLEVMLTTPVKHGTIVLGKLMSAMVTTFMYVIATLPFIAVAFTVGGLDWKLLFQYLGIIIYLDIYIGSIGIFFSCIKRTSVSAAISAIVTVVAVVLITYAAGKVCDSMMYTVNINSSSYGVYTAAKMTCYAINPVMWIADMIIRLMGDAPDVGVISNYGDYTAFVMEHKCAISVCINLCMAFIMLRIASVKLIKGSRRNKG